MIKKISIIIIGVVVLIGLGISIRMYYYHKVDTDVLKLIKEKHPDWSNIEPVREVAGVNQELLLAGKKITYVVQFSTKKSRYTWYYSSSDNMWMDYDYVMDKLVDP